MICIHTAAIYPANKSEHGSRGLTIDSAYPKTTKKQQQQQKHQTLHIFNYQCTYDFTIIYVCIVYIPLNTRMRRIYT